MCLCVFTCMHACICPYVLMWSSVLTLLLYTSHTFFPTDSIDTPSVIRHMRDLIGAGNSYIKSKNSNSDVILLLNIAKYLTRMFKVGIHGDLQFIVVCSEYKSCPV